MEQLLSVVQVAQIVGKEAVTVRRWCEQGRIPAVKIGRDWRIREQTVRRIVSGGLKISQRPGKRTQGPLTGRELLGRYRTLGISSDALAQDKLEEAALEEKGGRG